MPHIVRSIRASNTTNRPGRKYSRRLNRVARAHGYVNHGSMVEIINARVALAIKNGMPL